MKQVDQASRSALAGFRLVTRTYSGTKARANRGPAQVKIWPSGLAETNVAGAELVEDLVRAAKVDPHNCGLVFGGDEVAAQIAVLAVDADTAGATPMRRDPEKKTITLYLNDFFTEFPKLRPTSRKLCGMESLPDGADGHFIRINLNLGLNKPVVRQAAESAPAPVARAE